jgi:hypothetical protein
VAEAAARTGDAAAVQVALAWLWERTGVTRTEWVLGIEARVRALVSDGEVADGFYRESVERLGPTRVRAELARSHLLYGEWLLLECRRMDAREQLRTASDMLEDMGMGGSRSGLAVSWRLPVRLPASALSRLPGPRGR